MVDRPRLLRRAIRLEVFSVAYNVAEGVIGIVAGWLAGSVALMGFGLDSAIETASAIVVLLRMRSEAESKDHSGHAAAERRAERIVGATLIALSAYVLYESVSTLVRREAPHESPVGIGLALLSLLLMPILATAKRRTGHALGSRALIADATETLVCTYLSAALLIGLGLNAAFGWWWADPVAGLAMVPFIFREGREAWTGEECEDEEEEKEEPASSEAT